MSGLVTGLTGTVHGDKAPIVVNWVYNAPADSTIWVNNTGKTVRVHKIIVRPDVVGSDGGAVTLALKKAASGTAIASGTALNQSTADLKGTAHTNQVLTLSATAAALDVADGTAIGADVTGTTTAATGCVTVVLFVQ